MHLHIPGGNFIWNWGEEGNERNKFLIVLNTNGWGKLCKLEYFSYLSFSSILLLFFCLVFPESNILQQQEPILAVFAAITKHLKLWFSVSILLYSLSVLSRPQQRGVGSRFDKLTLLGTWLKSRESQDQCELVCVLKHCQIPSFEEAVIVFD